MSMPVPAKIKCPQVIDSQTTCGATAEVRELAPGSYQSTCTPAPGGRPHVQLFGSAYLNVAIPVQE